MFLEVYLQAQNEASWPGLPFPKTF